MKITMMISRYPPVRAGTELACQRLSHLLAANGQRVTVLTEKVSDYPTEQMERGVRVLRLSCFGRPPISSFIYCLKTLWLLLWGSTEWDVLHAHLIAGPAMVALLIGRLCRKPVLVKLGGAGVSGDIQTSRRTLRGRFKLRLFRAWAKHLVAVSPTIADEASALMGQRAAIHVIPNGVDTDFFCPATPEEKRQARRQLTLPDDGAIALYVGRWSSTKGIQALLEAMDEGLRQPGFAWHLRLVIAGDFMPTAKEQTSIERLGTHLSIAHNVADLRPHYKASDLAILLSQGEGLSNFLLEAMASGLPTFASKAAAIPGIDGVMILGDDQSAAQSCLAELRRLQADPKELQERGRRARGEAQRRFALSAIADAYAQLYRHLISR